MTIRDEASKTPFFVPHLHLTHPLGLRGKGGRDGEESKGEGRGRLTPLNINGFTAAVVYLVSSVFQFIIFM